MTDKEVVVAYLHEQGYENIKYHEDTQRWTASQKLMWGQARIVAGTLSRLKIGLDEEWVYPSVASATRGICGWNMTIGSEPQGWVRHKPSNRRRTYAADGIKYTQEVRP